MKNFIIILILGLCSCKQKQSEKSEILTSGQQLFAKNCGACHSKKSLLVMGPALEYVKTEKEVELLFNYLQNKKTLQTDTVFIPLTKGKKYHGINFPDMTKEEVKRIANYLN